MLKVGTKVKVADELNANEYEDGLFDPKTGERLALPLSFASEMLKFRGKTGTIIKIPDWDEEEGEISRVDFGDVCWFFYNKDLTVIEEAEGGENENP